MPAGLCWDGNEQDVRKRLDRGTETEVFQARQAGGRFLAGGYVRRSAIIHPRVCISAWP
jgi:hypothetical protein